ncbi:MAG TPA: hypothetical protein VEA77_07035 [Hyphomicrobium sp.]|nr:hypothetical protein [Hyphomicrobium sp.]
MTEDSTGLSFLLSGSTILLALAAFYVGRALWIARREWSQCGTDTKILYLLVAPVLTLAVDILEVTDRLFWSRRTGKTNPSVRSSAMAIKQAHAKPALATMRMRSKHALRSNG